MRRYVPASLWIVFILSFLFISCSKEAENPTASQQSGSTALDKTTHAKYKVVATGLNQPRGLRFGPDGYLYVSESGYGGSISTVGQCDQVPPPVGPYLGSNTGRISKIDWHGNRYTVADCLPATQTSQATGGDNTSIGDITFWGNELYALLSGAGCSHGHPEVPNGIIKVNRNGSWKLMANVSSFLKAHPVVNPEADDFEPDGDLYSMIRVGHYLYFIEANHGELDRYDLVSGTIERLTDISATQGHIVPTSIAYWRGNFYVGNLTTIPFPAGAAKILKISMDGKQVSDYATGFTTILGLRFDILGRLYVLETSTSTGQPPFLFPNSGKIKRINHPGSVEEIASGLNFPTAMTFGPDGNLYVSTSGYHSAPGTGEIVRVQIPFFWFFGPFDFDDEFAWLKNMGKKFGWN
ncbi:MAG: ScyD/ScyE family protein [Ignavibacteriales bacterium]